ncbi:migration and invasion enhancer 1 [Cephus cinctus]|uniref:Migration and invasion enhancer 1 n=1 Tax=Cephus cinctus TaxID=211228 RepID=A0AAJ7CF60_CEPCN|nr:migration and invasion enhancer 1 [Cephus cinctus]
MSDVRIDVEYCGSCGHRTQFIDLATLLRKAVPNVKISGTEGRQASFEVKINDQLVYSKLQTMAFPDFEAVSDLAKAVSHGMPIKKIEGQQPIDCAIS